MPLGECHYDVLAGSIQQTRFRLVLGQRRRPLTGFEPAMGYDAGPTLSWYWVGTWAYPQQWLTVSALCASLKVTEG